MTDQEKYEKCRLILAKLGAQGDMVSAFSTSRGYWDLIKTLWAADREHEATCLQLEHEFMEIAGSIRDADLVDKLRVVTRRHIRMSRPKAWGA